MNSGLRKLAAAAFALLFAVTSAVLAQDLQPVPALAGPVVDLTATLSAAEHSALSEKLLDWHRRTGKQLQVLLVATTQPENIEQYANRIGVSWGLGRKGKDDGVLLVVAMKDKRLRIEVGRGLEGELTDIASRRIISEIVAPHFKQQQFAAGLHAGVNAIMAVADGQQVSAVLQEGWQPSTATGPQSAPKKRVSSQSIETFLVFALIIIAVVGSILRRLFGKLGGSMIGAGIAGFAVWVITGLLLAAVAGAVIVLVLLLLIGSPVGWYLGRGGWSGGLGGGGWSSGGGVPWSGGGGDFGGGGASGSWD